MKVERIEEMRLSPEDDAKIADLLARCFSTDYGGRSFFFQRHHVRLVVRAPEIVGHIALAYRAIRVGDDIMTIAGLAEVATDPDRRGQGIASALLRASIDEAKASAADFLLLFGNAGLYRGQGFVAASNPMRFQVFESLRSQGYEESHKEELMVLPLRGGSWPGDKPVDLLGHKF